MQAMSTDIAAAHLTLTDGVNYEAKAKTHHLDQNQTLPLPSPEQSSVT